MFNLANVFIKTLLFNFLNNQKEKGDTLFLTEIVSVSYNESRTKSGKIQSTRIPCILLSSTKFRGAPHAPKHAFRGLNLCTRRSKIMETKISYIWSHFMVVFYICIRCFWSQSAQSLLILDFRKCHSDHTSKESILQAEGSRVKLGVERNCWYRIPRNT